MACPYCKQSPPVFLCCYQCDSIVYYICSITGICWAQRPHATLEDRQFMCQRCREKKSNVLTESSENGSRKHQLDQKVGECSTSRSSPSPKGKENRNSEGNSSKSDNVPDKLGKAKTDSEDDIFQLSLDEDDE